MMLSGPAQCSLTLRSTLTKRHSSPPGSPLPAGARASRPGFSHLRRADLVRRKRAGEIVALTGGAFELHLQRAAIQARRCHRVAVDRTELAAGRGVVGLDLRRAPWRGEHGDRPVTCVGSARRISSVISSGIGSPGGTADCARSQCQRPTKGLLCAQALAVDAPAQSPMINAIALNRLIAVS